MPSITKVYSARILSAEENGQIWETLKFQFDIPIQNWQEKFGFVENRKGRLWLGSKTALEFLIIEHMDPAKSLTTAIGSRVKNKEGDIKGIRLTLNGVLVFGKDLRKNLVILTSEEEKLWFAGDGFPRAGLTNGVYILLSSDNHDPIGCSTIKNEWIPNFLPKWRRFPRN